MRTPVSVCFFPITSRIAGLRNVLQKYHYTLFIFFVISAIFLAWNYKFLNAETKCF